MKVRLRVNKILVPYEKMDTKTSFEKESFKRNCGTASVESIARYFGFINWVDIVNWPP